jgi:tetratricopeptide (TPR) repeat protein
MGLISDLRTIEQFNQWDSIEKQNKSPFATKHLLAVEDGKLVIVERGFFGKLLITMGFSSSCMSKVEKHISDRLMTDTVPPNMKGVYENFAQKIQRYHEHHPEAKHLLAFQAIILTPPNSNQTLEDMRLEIQGKSESTLKRENDFKNLALYYLDKGRPDDAIDALEKHISEGDDLIAHLLLFKAHTAAGNRQLAHDHLDYAIALSPYDKSLQAYKDTATHAG